MVENKMALSVAQDVLRICTLFCENSVSDLHSIVGYIVSLCASQTHTDRRLQCRYTRFTPVGSALGAYAPPNK